MYVIPINHPSKHSVYQRESIFLTVNLWNSETSANDPAPYIKEGRTLIPFRRIFEALGMDVGWDPVLSYGPQPKAMALK